MLSLYGFALLAGIATAIEPGQNAGLAKSLARPLLAGVVSLVVSVAAICVAMLVTGQYGWPTLDRLAQVPWWAWLGGFLSILLILAQLYASPAIGAATFLGIIVTVGVLASLVLDHFGWIGFPVHPASVWRVAGAVLMVIGVGLVALF